MKAKAILTAFVFFLNSYVFSQSKTVTDSVTVFVFLSESCPICQSYTLPLKELYKKYNHKKVKFIGLFPNYYVTQQDVDAFKKKYALPFELLKDKDGLIAQQFNAAITPQVFVQDSQQKIIYSGRIDNSFYAIGKRRNIITVKDLDMALSEFLSGQAIKTPMTQAVGCVISAKE